MCRALRVLCAAADADRLAGLRRACVSAEWELVGGVSSLGQLEAQALEWRPDVVVVEAALGEEAVQAVRGVRPEARVISVGSLPGVDAVAGSLEDVRSAVFGLPRPGGPVRAP